MNTLFKVLPLKIIPLKSEGLLLGRQLSKLATLLYNCKSFKLNFILKTESLPRKLQNSTLKIRTIKNIKYKNLKYVKASKRDFLIIKSFYNMLPTHIQKQFLKILKFKLI